MGVSNGGCSVRKWRLGTWSSGVLLLVMAGDTFVDGVQLREKLTRAVAGLFVPTPRIRSAPAVGCRRERARDGRDSGGCSVLTRSASKRPSWDERQKTTDAVEEIRRLSVRGVSVSPLGFLVLCSAATEGAKSGVVTGGEDSGEESGGLKVTIPFCVTSSKEDEIAATSPEALTILQLLSGVDMAGAILPPQILQHIVALWSSDDAEVDTSDESDVIAVEDELGLSELQQESLKEEKAREFVRAFVQQTLPGDADSYMDAHPWFRSRVKLPTVELNQVRISLPMTSPLPAPSDICRLSRLPPLRFALECTVDNGEFAFAVPLLTQMSQSTDAPTITDDLVCDSVYNYDPSSSAAFLGIALALRYKCPLVIDGSTLQRLCTSSPQQSTNGYLIFGTEDAAISTVLPQWKGIDSLRDASNRVVQSIERGFEVTKLRAALRIAEERGDDLAAQKIQAEIQRLSTQPPPPTPAADADRTKDVPDDLEVADVSPSVSTIRKELQRIIEEEEENEQGADDSSIDSNDQEQVDGDDSGEDFL